MSPRAVGTAHRDEAGRSRAAILRIAMAGSAAADGLVLHGDWMARLARHFERVRRARPRDPLMIVFDIDGTILDMRYPVLHLLREYDRVHGTAFFGGLRLDEVDAHEARLEPWLERAGLSEAERARVVHFCSERFWEPHTVHRPFPGALEVIRWFQIQPRTFVGLNTGRPESMRETTLRALNALGAEWRVRFQSEHLVMNPGGWETIVEAKCRGLRCLRDAGFRVFAFVDNEPANLAAVAESIDDPDVLLLHADTIFESQRESLPPMAVSGARYELASLLVEPGLPAHVEWVWQAVNDATSLEDFLGSGVRWAEVDVRRDPASGELVLGHDPIDPGARGRGSVLSLNRALAAFADCGRGVKLDLKEGDGVVAEALAIVERHGFREDALWFNAELSSLTEQGFRELRERVPGAVLQCPMDFALPLFAARSGGARELAAELADWGIDRFSLRWDRPGLSRAVDQLTNWGHEVNLYEVPDLDSLFRAALLLPRSVTARFDRPMPGGWGNGRNRTDEEP